MYNRKTYSLIMSAFMILITFVVFTSCQNNELYYSDEKTETTTEMQVSNNFHNTDTTETLTEADTDKENVEEDIRCSLIQENDIYYIQISGGNFSDNQTNNQEHVPCLEFDNIQSFVDTLKSGNYSDKQLRQLSKFPMVDGKIKICNLENLYYPTINGEIVSGSYMEWYGEKYLWFFYDTNENFDGWITPISMDKYLNQESLCKELTDAYTVIDSEVTNDGKQILYYETGISLIYTLYQDSKEFTVLEEFYYEDYENGNIYIESISDYIPSDVYIFGKDGSLMYAVVLNSIKSDITDDIIFSIDMEKYLPPVAELEPQPENVIK